MSPAFAKIQLDWTVKAFHPNNKIIAVLAYSNLYKLNKKHYICIWCIETNKELYYISCEEPITTASYSANGEWLISSSPSGVVDIWSIYSREKLETIAVSDCHIRNLFFCSSYENIIATCSNGMIKTWRLKPAYRLLNNFDPLLVSEALQFIWEMELDGLNFVSKPHKSTLMPQTGGHYLRFTKKTKKYATLLKPPLENETKLEQLVRFLDELSLKDDM